MSGPIYRTIWIGCLIPTGLIRYGVVDITYIWAGNLWIYLAAVLDLYSRRVIGRALSDRADAGLVVKALDMAYQQRNNPTRVLFHLDQGSQFASRLFMALSHQTKHEQTW